MFIKQALSRLESSCRCGPYTLPLAPSTPHCLRLCLVLAVVFGLVLILVDPHLHTFSRGRHTQMPKTAHNTHTHRGSEVTNQNV